MLRDFLKKSGKHEDELDIRYHRMVPYEISQRVDSYIVSLFPKNAVLSSKIGAEEHICRLNPALDLKMVFMDFK